MILPSLQYLANELNRFEFDNPIDPDIELGNVARLDLETGAASAGNQRKVLLTLVNIEEEKTLRNDPFYLRKTDPVKGDQIIKRNATLHLNLYVLISCADDYPKALGRLDKVIRYLQGKNVFTAATADPGDNYPEAVDKIILDLFSLNFEQINHLWSILGGKYVPSVLYKMRLLPVQAGRAETVGRVEEVRTGSNINN